MTDSPRPRRGFANMTPERQREIAALGGRSIKPENRSFSRDSNLAASAGSKGGKACPPETRSFSRDRELAQEAGRKGGLTAGRNRRKEPQA